MILIERFLLQAIIYLFKNSCVYRSVKNSFRIWDDAWDGSNWNLDSEKLMYETSDSPSAFRTSREVCSLVSTEDGHSSFTRWTGTLCQLSESVQLSTKAPETMLWNAFAHTHTNTWHSVACVTAKITFRRNVVRRLQKYACYIVYETLVGNVPRHPPGNKI